MCNPITINCNYFITADDLTIYSDKLAWEVYENKFCLRERFFFQFTLYPTIETELKLMQIFLNTVSPIVFTYYNYN